MLTKSLIVAFGSAIGGVLRFWVGVIVIKLQALTFPWDTLAVNIVGSFIIGLLSAISPSENSRLFLMVGICGGFTTFSSFSLQTLQLLGNERIGMAAVNIVVSLVVCLGATALGLFIGRA